MPVVAPTIATVVSPLLHVPPLTEPVNVFVVPVHKPVAPVITGIGSTLIVLVTAQLPIAYVITAGPDAIPVIIPDAEPIVAAVPVVVHVPPLTPSVSVIDAPAHTAASPPMAAGAGFTVTGLVAEQPVVATV